MGDVELRMNVAALKRVDPYMKDILGTATQVALYTFSAAKNEWEKMDVEGALFVCSRTGEPFHNMLIMNRLNTSNLVEPVVKELDWQMKAPFLLYRNARNRIYGIWFYNRDECVKITYLLEKIADSLTKKQPDKDKAARQAGRKPDIFSMLTKAQQDFTQAKPAPVAANAAASAAAAAAAAAAAEDDDTAQSVKDFFAKATSKSAAQAVAPSDQEQLQPLLQRLMNNPVHSVEHIEKQQRSATPHDPQKTLENGLRIASPREQPAAAVSPLNISTGGSFAETPQKTPQPALMPPMMFASTAAASATAAAAKDSRPEPLTAKQLLQALSYMLKNDPDFVQKLHEAYVKSFAEMVH